MRGEDGEAACPGEGDVDHGRHLGVLQRRTQPHFANARSIRNALDRMRLRQANRLFEQASGPLDADALSEIDAVDILASRVFQGGINSAADTKDDTR